MLEILVLVGSTALVGVLVERFYREHRRARQVARSIAAELAVCTGEESRWMETVKILLSDASTLDERGLILGPPGMVVREGEPLRFEVFEGLIDEIPLLREPLPERIVAAYSEIATAIADHAGLTNPLSVPNDETLGIPDRTRARLKALQLRRVAARYIRAKACADDVRANIDALYPPRISKRTRDKLQSVPEEAEPRLTTGGVGGAVETTCTDRGRHPDHAPGPTGPGGPRAQRRGGRALGAPRQADLGERAELERAMEHGATEDEGEVE